MLNALATVGACASKHYKAKIKKGVEARPNIYTLTFQTPGERKSSNYTPFVKAVKRWVKKMQDWWEDAKIDIEIRAGKIEALKRQIKNGSTDSPEADTAEVKRLQKEPVASNPDFTASDGTPEALAQAMSECGERLFLSSSDAKMTLAIILGKYSRDGKVDDGFILKSYDGEPYSSLRRGEGRSVKMDDPCLSIALTTQVRELENIKHRPELIESGFMSRFSFCLPDALAGAVDEDGELVRKFDDAEISEAKTKENNAQLKIATCQFPVSNDIGANAHYIKKYILEASENKADLVHFSEAALSGYGGMDLPNFDGFDWDNLRAQTHEIMALAQKHSIWVILGSAHYISPEEKPTNCLYIISNEGEIVERYDKSMCTTSDLNVYTPGNRIVTIDINGLRCGFLICYDACFPEMYNIYRHKGVEVMFHSFYNARYQGKTILDEIIPAEIRVRASDNLLWVVANNSSAEYSSWPTCIARPDGSMMSLERGKPGLLYRTFPDEIKTKDFPSWTHNNKKMALPPTEVYHNGVPSTHPRVTNSRALP